MTELIFAAWFFLGLHLGIAGTAKRDRAIENLGETAYRATFSILSLLGIFWLAHAYARADYIETWGQLVGFKPYAAGLMFVAFLLVVLGGKHAKPHGYGWRNTTVRRCTGARDTANNPSSVFMGR